MKRTNRSNLFRTSMALLGLFAAASAVAAPGDYRIVHQFTSGAGDGGWPMTAPVVEDGSLYGMTPYGGVSSWGAIYRIELAGSNYTHLYSFTGPSGKYPLGAVLLNGTNLYGMTSRGGQNGDGVVFRIGTNGTGLSVLHHFDSTNRNDGAAPWGDLIVDGGRLYGMTYNGGITNRGVVFSIGTDGSGYTNLHLFVGGAGDGKHPKGKLLLDGGRLYGMTSEGGTNNAGAIFAVRTDGTGYTNLYEFSGDAGDGKNPSGSLIKDGVYLYGMAHGGQGNAGVAFCIHTNGGTMNFMWYFAASAADGGEPYGDLLKHDTKLYGMTRYGGSNSAGVIVSLGSGYTNQHSWVSGGEPVGALTASGDILYGTTVRGGESNKGAVFQFEMDTNDGASAWCKLAWIDGGGFSDTLAGDLNSERMYVAHGWASGAPDYAFIGYGLTPDFDDASWTWLPMAGAGGAGIDYEYTGVLARAAAGDYLVAAKFIKGSHVYYTKNPDATGWNNWGDWNTALYATNRWTVNPLAAPSNAYARYMTTNDIDVHFNGDGTHWVSVFRKPGADPSFESPRQGTEYYVGDNYAGQGECVYRGAANLYSDTGLVANAVQHYRLYTENWSFYSTGSIATASTDPARDDDGDAMPNQYEVDEGFNPGLASDGLLDADTDTAPNWEEYIAGTDPRNSNSVLSIVETWRGSTAQSCAFTWSSIAGKQYTVWRTTNILTGFDVPVSSNITATSPENTYTDTVAAAVSIFYRVQVQR